jgi:hypothetical protein
MVASKIKDEIIMPAKNTKNALPLVFILTTLGLIKPIINKIKNTKHSIANNPLINDIFISFLWF